MPFVARGEPQANLVDYVSGRCAREVVVPVNCPRFVAVEARKFHGRRLFWKVLGTDSQNFPYICGIQHSARIYEEKMYLGFEQVDDRGVQGFQ